MTLILNCITKDYAIQVSDRLFTYLDPATGMILDREDGNNKCVLLSDIMSFGYAGHGEIDKIRTDLWLAEILHSASGCNNLSSIFNLVRDKATNSFNKIHISPNHKRHAFVGIGWTRYSQENSLSPILVTISNFHNEKGNQLDEAIEYFNIIVSPRFVRPGKHYFLVIGQQPETNNEKQLFYYINRLLKRCSNKNVMPKILMGLLVIAIRNLVAMREESGRYNTIGRNLLGVCLPKSSVMRDHLPGIPGSKLLLSCPPVDGVATCFYFPYDQNDEIQYGPITVFPGGPILGEMKIGPSKIEDEQNPIKIWDAFKMIVLSEVIGFGSWTDKHRPAIGDDYSLIGYQDLIAHHWPKDEPCPYYGSLIGINAEPEILSKIQDDPNYVIILQDKILLSEIPEENWLQKLVNWFAYRKMSQDEKKDFISNMSGLSREDIIEKLLQFLKIPAKLLIN